MAHAPSGYRPDIDGMRAIAVLAVAGYHAEIPGFSGGFVGVDIFFVISGYLITRIIADAAARGAFSYWEFYERRARRILPALFVVGAAVAIFTVIYRSPRDVDIFGESVTLFAVFAANFFFYTQLDYFADPVEFYPLLHTWSLAVEEQFYLIFPPLFLLLSSLAPGRIGAVLAGLAAVSLVASVVVVWFVDPQLAFFHTPFRMWELLAGGLLAVIRLPMAPAKAWEALAAFGAVLLAAPVLMYQSEMLFPGFAALPPVLGATLIVAAGLDGRSTVVGRMLSWPPLVYVGLASYSFYLWHWPALSAARYLTFQPLELLDRVGVLAIALALAVLSLHFIERPFRRGGGIVGRRGVFGLAAAGVAGFVVLGWALQETRGWPQRFAHLAPLTQRDASQYGLTPGRCAPALDAVREDLRGAIDPSFCAVSQPANPSARVFYWGDSHIWALAPGLAAAAEIEGWRSWLAWSAVCAPLIGFDRPGPTRFHDCAAHNRAAPALAADLQADIVVLAARWRAYDASDVLQRLPETISQLSGAGARVVVIDQAPTLAFHAPTTLFRAAVIGRDHGFDLAPSTLETRTPEAVAEFRQVVEAAGGVYLSLFPALCSDAACRVTASDGAPLYADNHHLSRIGAREIGPFLARMLAP